MSSLRTQGSRGGRSVEGGERCEGQNKAGRNKSGPQPKTKGFVCYAIRLPEFSHCLWRVGRWFQRFKRQIPSSPSAGMLSSVASMSTYPPVAGIGLYDYKAHCLVDILDSFSSFMKTVSFEIPAVNSLVRESDFPSAYGKPCPHSPKRMCKKG
jgi:hypothetical protein